MDWLNGYKKKWIAARGVKSNKRRRSEEQKIQK